jgi:hypothetical protein
MNIVEDNHQEEKPEVKIRRGGKEKLNIPPKKHSVFYYQINFNKPASDELKNKVKSLIQPLSEQVENEVMVMAGSEQGEKTFNLPINDTRENLKKRIEHCKVKYSFEVNKENNLCLHYVFAVSKRALNTQINTASFKILFENLFGNAVSLKSFIFRDAKSEISIYSQKHPL